MGFVAIQGSRPSVIVLGGINIDFIAVAPRLPGPGETIVGQQFYTTPGGKGANQAVAAMKLGALVKMIGRVGNDEFGPRLVRDLEGHGVDVTGVATDPRNGSGVAIILLDRLRQNHIVQVRGANMACDVAQLEAASSAMDGADVLMLQLEVPSEVSLAAARQARDQAVTVVWDPAPAAEFPDEVYEAVDVLTPNQVEAEALTGVAVADIPSARRAAESMLDRGVPLAVVKLGEEGAYYASREEGGHIPAPRVNVVDTVAAGDAFGAALAVALAAGISTEEAVRRGVAAGAVAVTKPGAQEAMPTRGEVEALLRTM